MRRSWFILAAILLAGCSPQPGVDLDYEPPPPTDTNFERLPLLLSDIQKGGDVLLYEGLPGEFWDPQLQEQELREKETTGLHGYWFYEELLPLKSADGGQLTTLFSAAGSFQRYRPQKPCGAFHPDYCVVWKGGEAVTEALISLECGEVKMFGPQGELHCDLSPESAQALKPLLVPYRKNRPDTEPSP